MDTRMLQTTVNKKKPRQTKRGFPAHNKKLF